MKCPNCNATVPNKRIRPHGLAECPACQAVTGTSKASDGYSAIKPFFDASADPEPRPFDIVCATGARCVGHYNPVTRHVQMRIS